MYIELPTCIIEINQKGQRYIGRYVGMSTYDNTFTNAGLGAGTDERTPQTFIFVLSLSTLETSFTDSYNISRSFGSWSSVCHAPQRDIPLCPT